jgi:hypothetical protein
MLAHIKANGITPGIHFLQTHIGLWSRYVTPVADYRLNLTRHFTLSKPLTKGDTTIYVANNPEGTVMADDCRILKFGGGILFGDDGHAHGASDFGGSMRGGVQFRGTELVEPLGSDRMPQELPCVKCHALPPPRRLRDRRN